MKASLLNSHACPVGEKPREKLRFLRRRERRQDSCREFFCIHVVGVLQKPHLGGMDGAQRLLPGENLSYGLLFAETCWKWPPEAAFRPLNRTTASNSCHAFRKVYPSGATGRDAASAGAWARRCRRQRSTPQRVNNLL
jgi:hypothetical protein